MLLDVLRTAYRWYGFNRAPFELLGLGLAVLGTMFAVLSIKGGEKLTRDLRMVFDHLTTREVGAFPAYMQEVEHLIGEARESIFVATDFPAHGVWRDRGRYGAYVKALENRKADRVRKGHPLNIQLLTLDSAGRERALDADLRFAERWEYPGLMPMYLWIIDGEKALFAIPSFGDQLTEYGFVTQEAGLVQALLSVWSRYVDASRRVSSAPALTSVKAS